MAQQLRAVRKQFKWPALVVPHRRRSKGGVSGAGLYRSTSRDVLSKGIKGESKLQRNATRGTRPATNKTRVEGGFENVV